MKDVFLCLDVGGTQIKGAAIGKDGEMCGNILYFDSRAGEGKGALLEHFAEILRRILPQGAEAAGIRMAFPGPFDYERGICLIRGLDKYESLYGADLRREISGRLGIGPQRVRFANDAAAFALGEMGFGQARGAERVLCVCIGTGCGSAFGMGGRLAVEGTRGVPEDGYIYNAPFLEGSVDDYISRRGLMALSPSRARHGGGQCRGGVLPGFRGQDTGRAGAVPEGLLSGRAVPRRPDHGQCRPVPGPGGGVLHGGGDTGLHYRGHIPAHAPGADPYLYCLTISLAVKSDCITLTGSIA